MSSVSDWAAQGAECWTWLFCNTILSGSWEHWDLWTCRLKKKKKKDLQLIFRSCKNYRLAVKIDTISHLLLWVHPWWVHPVRHGGILLTVAIMSETHQRKDKSHHLKEIVLFFQLLRHKHAETYSDLCCDGYLLGEYMLPSLLEGPMLFWLPGGPMPPSIPMTCSGLRCRQSTHFKNQTGHSWSSLLEQ